MIPKICSDEKTSNDDSNNVLKVEQSSSATSSTSTNTANTYSIIVHCGNKIRRHYSKPATSPYFIPISNQRDKMRAVDNENSNSSVDSDIQYQAVPARRENRSSSLSSSSGCSSIMEEVVSPANCRCTSMHTSDYDEEDCDYHYDNSPPNSVLSLANNRRHNRCNNKHAGNNSRTLIDIAMRTITLIRRNQELQNRLHELQRETNCFIQSVMANPENEVLRRSQDNK